MGRLKDYKMQYPRFTQFRNTYNMNAACEELGLTEDRIRALVRNGVLKTLAHYENNNPKALNDIHLREAFYFNGKIQTQIKRVFKD